MVDESLLLLLQGLQQDISKISERTLSLQEKTAGMGSELVNLRNIVDSLEKCIVKGNGQPSLVKVVARNSERLDHLEGEAASGKDSRRWYWTTCIAAIGLLVSGLAVFLG